MIREMAERVVEMSAETLQPAARTRVAAPRVVMLSFVFFAGLSLISSQSLFPCYALFSQPQSRSGSILEILESRGWTDLRSLWQSNLWIPKGCQR